MPRLLSAGQAKIYNVANIQVKEAGMLEKSLGDRSILATMVKNWWLIVLRGFIALVLGIAILAMEATVAAAFLVLFLGCYALVDGLFALVIGLVNRPPHKDRGWLIAEGAIGILAGIGILVAPLLAAVFLMYFIAFWAIMTGIMEVVFAAVQWKHIPEAWMVLVYGILSVLVGALILVNVLAGALLIVIMIGIYLIFFGTVLIALGFAVKGKDPSRLEDA